MQKRIQDVQDTISPKDAKVLSTRLTTYFWVLIAVWTTLVIGLLSLDFLQIGQVQQEMAKTEARANFNKDQAFRFWASKHGGVYVPINSRTPSNPFLSHVPERDITTESGKALTMMNPAYMLRQMMEEYEDLFGIRGHITSLKHYRAETAPDEWERSALMAFERGDKEVLEFTEIEGTPYLRLMRPMIAKKGCLKCHAKQDYKVGDVRGGVSISVPMTLHLTNQRKVFTTHAFGLGLMWLLGIAGIGMATRGLKNRIRERDRAEAELQKAHGRLEIRVDERTGELKNEIEERKRVEEALRESEEKYSKFFHSNPQWLSISNLEDGRFLEVNEAFTEITGYERDEIIGKTSKERGLWPDPDERSRFVKLALEQDGFREQEVTFIKKNGELMSALWSVAPIEIMGTGYLISAITDITELKQAEEALRESEERFRTVADFTYDWEYWIAPDGHYVYVSPSCERITGYGSEEFINDHELLQKIVHPDDQSTFASHFCHLEQQKRTSGFDFRIITRSGEERWINHVCQPVYMSEGDHLGQRASNRDISKQKFMQEKLLETQKMEAIATLAGGVAHEFNNALMGIMGNIELLKMDLPEDEGREKSFEAMNESGHRMSRLTDQLLAYSEGGKYNAKNLKLDDFVIDTLPILQHDLNNTVRVETHFSKDVSYIKADHAQMQMVLSAILANSIEAVEDEGIIKITAENKDVDGDFTKQPPGLKPGSYVCFTIEDDGKGMDEEAKDGIFEPFFTTKFQGRGMGMAAVYGIIKSHDGWIYVDSEVGKGTVVRIYLPAVEVKEEAKEVKQPEVEIARGEGTILIIEDEETLVFMFRQILEMLGYRVLVAMTGKDAVELAKTFDGQIDLALLDIKLPDMEGGRVYPLIMEARPDMKVIVCSGYSIHGPAQDILDAGAEGFIQKPFSIAPFSEKLKEVLEGK